jgi:hypothetical protein
MVCRTPMLITFFPPYAKTQLSNGEANRRKSRDNTNSGEKYPNKPSNDRQSAAAQTTYTIRLDSTQNIPPKLCHLPAHVVETRITVAGDTRSTKNLALAVRCIGLVRRPQIGKTTPEPNDHAKPTKHPFESNARLMTTLKRAWCHRRRQIYFTNFSRLQRQIHADRPEGTRPCLQSDFPRRPAHDWARRWRMLFPL